jgi:glycosyltransferase involved in cell wall biosynthesis
VTVSGAPLVSVLLCTYQQREYLREAVESVLAQTYRPLELIVIDNGSTDGSAEWLRPHAEDGRLRLIAHRVNAPLTRRLNEAVKECRGAFVSLLFGDDYYLPDKLAAQVARFATLGADYGVVYSPGYRLDQRTGERHRWSSLHASGQVLEAMLQNYGRASINPIAPLIRRECLLEHPFDESVRLIADSVFLFIALSYRFEHVDEPLFVMRDHGGNVGWAYKRNFEDGRIVFDHLQRHPRFPPRLRERILDINAVQARDLAWKIARFADDAGDARRYLWMAARWRPRRMLHPRAPGALALSLLPRAVRRGLSDAAGRLKGQARERVYRENY